MLHRAIEPRRLPPLPGWTVTELLVSISILITLALLTFSWIRPAFTSADVVLKGLLCRRLK